jgi:hypothetical protein
MQLLRASTNRHVGLAPNASSGLKLDQAALAAGPQFALTTGDKASNVDAVSANFPTFSGWSDDKLDHVQLARGSIAPDEVTGPLYMTSRWIYSGFASNLVSSLSHKRMPPVRPA